MVNTKLKIEIKIEKTKFYIKKNLKRHMKSKNLFSKQNIKK